MNGRASVTVSLLVLIRGIASFLASFLLEEYRVKSVQPNGLLVITHPLYLGGFALGLPGIGMVIFGNHLHTHPVRIRGIRRAVFGSALTAGGVPLILLSIYAAIGNCFELGLHSCGTPQSDPVCGSIFWLIVDFAVIGVVSVW